MTAPMSDHEADLWREELAAGPGGARPSRAVSRRPRSIPLDLDAPMRSLTSAAGLTQTALARVRGVTQPAQSNAEAAGDAVSVRVLREAADAAGFEMEIRVRRKA